MKKVFFIVLLSLNLHAFIWNFSVQAAIYLANFEGNITNYKDSTDFSRELQYEKGTLSYFATELRTSLWYIPTLNVDHINIIETANADLNNSHIIGTDFNGTVTSNVNYRITNFRIFKSFIHKGPKYILGNRKIYIGDLELDLGINVKYLVYRLQIVDNSIENPSNNFLDVNQFIGLPYVGMRYYYYNTIFYANISALGVSKVKAEDYTYGVEYRVYKTIYFGFAYASESFEAVEKEDKIRFSSSGTKLSVKFIF